MSSSSGCSSLSVAAGISGSASGSAGSGSGQTVSAGSASTGSLAVSGVISGWGSLVAGGSSVVLSASSAGMSSRTVLPMATGSNMSNGSLMMSDSLESGMNLIGIPGSVVRQKEPSPLTVTRSLTASESSMCSKKAFMKISAFVVSTDASPATISARRGRAIISFMAEAVF